MPATQLSDFYASNYSQSWEIVSLLDQENKPPIIELDDRVYIYPCDGYACIDIREPGYMGQSKVFLDKGTYVGGGMLVHEGEELVFTATLEGDPEVLVFDLSANGSGTRAPAEGEADDDPE